MALIIRLLGTGSTTANANTLLYSVSATTTGAIVHNVRIVNTGSNGTVNLFYTPSGGSQIRILDRDLSLLANDILVVKQDLTMGPSDKIEVTTNVAMEYVLSGVERT